MTLAETVATKAGQYRAALDEANREAGRGDEGWSHRFIAALDARGLCLGDYMAGADYPNGQAYESPRPPGFDGWPVGTCVIWKS